MAILRPPHPGTLSLWLLRFRHGLAGCKKPKGAELQQLKYGMLNKINAQCKAIKRAVSGSVANWYIYIPDFTNLVYFLDRLVGEIMVWYMSLNLVYFYAFW